MGQLNIVNEYTPLRHYQFPALDVECCCAICRSWRVEREAFDTIKALTYDHQRSCFCWRCKQRRQKQQSFLAAASKRELYCELSWHASRHAGTYGPVLMKWVSKEITKETDGWWATFGQSYPLSYWLARFQSAITNVVSGLAVSGIAA